MMTHLVIVLRGARWDALQRLVTTPDVIHKSGGVQNRKRKWAQAMNIAAQSITLDADDIAFIIRQIINKRGGGWQHHIHTVFAGAHPLFSRLPILPAKRRA